MNLPKLTNLRLSIALICLVILLFLLSPHYLVLMELKAYDVRLLARGKIEPTQKVVVVAIDEKSLDDPELGRWQWSRSKQAKLIDALREYKVSIVGLDIYYPEPEKTLEVDGLEAINKKVAELNIENQELKQFIKNLKKVMSPDYVLAKAIERAGNVIVSNFFIMSEDEMEHLSSEEKRQKERLFDTNAIKARFPAIRMSSSSLKEVKIKEPYFAMPTIEIIANAAKALAYTNFFPDSDGVVRSIPLVTKYRGSYFPPLSFQCLRFYLGDVTPIVNISELGVEEVRLREISIPTDERGWMFINYRGPKGTFPYYSATDVIHHRIPSKKLEGKIALVGATATGIFDLRVTPFYILPGVEVHANIIDNILRGDFIRRPGWTSLLDVLVIIGLGLCLGLVIPRTRALPGAMIATGLLAVYTYLNWFLLVKRGIWLNAVYPYIVVVVVYLGLTIYRYVTEEAEKRKIRGAFESYVPPTVVGDILKNPEKLKLGGDRKELTVLFSDIRGFTTISESLDPEDLVSLLNDYLTTMTKVVFRYEGTLDKYIGDAMMAIYGAPIEQEDHPWRACATALDMMKALEDFQRKWEGTGAPRIDIGIGINTGPMMVGNMGSDQRFDYTVMGDSVNLSSRLEGINKEYGTHIIISEFTYGFVKEKIVCRELDRVKVKGKRLPVRIFELIGRADDFQGDGEFLQVFEEGLRLYQQRDFQAAIRRFREVLKIYPEDMPAKLYIKRCRDYLNNPPPDDWDRVYTMMKK